MPWINDFIAKYTPKDYSDLPHLHEGVLDCSLGVNPCPLPQAVMDALGKITEDVIKNYPHDDAATTRLAEWYKARSPSLGWLTKDNMLLGCGSLDILFNINLLCLTRSRLVLGQMPQFTAYVDHVNYTGSIYDGYALAPEKNYQFAADDYIAAMKPEHRLFVVENPNNPTGQVIALADIRKIADRAGELNAILLVDEAYGDYMDIDNSAINLIAEAGYAHVIVTRTFSKGFGMAGMRMGYAVASTQVFPDIGSDILAQLRKLVNTFSCNGIARRLAIAMLDSGANPPIDSAELQADKKRIMNIFDKADVFRAAATSLRTPLLTLICAAKDAPAGFNLQLFLLKKADLLTVSCGTYDNLDAKAVRIMLPAHERIGELEAKLKAAQNLIQKGIYI